MRSEVYKWLLDVFEFLLLLNNKKTIKRMHAHRSCTNDIMTNSFDFFKEYVVVCELY